MKRESVGRTVIARGWMFIVAAVVVAAAAFAVYRLHGVFGSNVNTATPGGGAGEIAPFNPKTVLLFGDAKDTLQKLVAAVAVA